MFDLIRPHSLFQSVRFISLIYTHWNNCGWCFRFLCYFDKVKISYKRKICSELNVLRSDDTEMQKLLETHFWMVGVQISFQPSYEGGNFSLSKNRINFCDFLWVKGRKGLTGCPDKKCCQTIKDCYAYRFCKHALTFIVWSRLNSTIDLTQSKCKVVK